MSSRTSKVLALSLGRILTTFVALVSGMVMARILTQTELATYRQTLLAYQVAVPLLSLGLSQGIYYFMPAETKRVRGLVIDALIMMFVMGLLYAVFIALGGNHVLARRFSNPAIVNTLAYLVPVPLVMLPAGLLSSVMVVRDQVNKLTVYNVLTNLVLALGIIGACLYWKNPESMILARVGISIIIGLLGIKLMLSAVPKDDAHPSFGNMRKMVRFSIPLVLASSLGAISLQLDKIIVSSMCSPEAFAVYSNGAMEIPLVSIITGSIASIILPDLRRFSAAGDYQSAVALFRQAAEKSAVILIPVMIFLMISAKPFILTLFSSKYEGSVLPFRLYLLILPMRLVSFGSFMMALGQSRQILYRSFTGLIVNAALSILFVHYVGFIGAIFATIISLYCIEGTWCVLAISRGTGFQAKRILPFSLIGFIALIAFAGCVPIFLLEKIGGQIPAPIMLLLNATSFVLTVILLTWVFDIKILKAEALRLIKHILPRERG